MPVNAAPPPPPRRTPAAKAPVESPITKDRREALEGLGQLGQVPLIALRQYADAGAVNIYVPAIAREIAVLAETQPQVAALIDPIIKAGPYAGLVAVVLPFILQVGVNHKRIPAGAMGTVPPSTLSAQVEAQLAEVELQALQAQAAAEAAAAQLREQIAESRRLIVVNAPTTVVDG